MRTPCRCREEYEAGQVFDFHDFKNAVDEMETLIDQVLLKDNADRKIGVCGFCMGGALTLATAALVVSMYGQQCCCDALLLLIECSHGCGRKKILPLGKPS